MTVMGAVRLRRVKDERLQWKAIYVVEGREDLWVESKGDPMDPTAYIGWDLSQLVGLNRTLIHHAETLPVMRKFIGKYLNPKTKKKVNGHALPSKRSKRR